jgi:hypothetical protein
VASVMWNLVLVCLEIVCQSKIGARFVPNIPMAQKSFLMHPMVLLGDEAQVEARFRLFGDSANLDTR